MGNINKKYYIFILLSLVIGITYKFFLTKETSFSTEHTPIVMSAETKIPESEKPKLNIVDYDNLDMLSDNQVLETLKQHNLLDKDYHLMGDDLKPLEYYHGLFCDIGTNLINCKNEL